MKDTVKIIESNVPYTKMNQRRSTYDILEVDGYKITRDISDGILEERYRPRLLDDILAPENVITKLRGNIKENNIKNLIFYSQNGGSGKTSLSGVLANETKRDFLTISANLDGGLAVIREKIQGFASTKSMYGEKKIVLLEEVGDLSSKALDMLKSVFDQYSSNVTLIMTTNSLANVSGPLQTRFNIYDFNKVPDEYQQTVLKNTYKRLLAILDIEDIEYEVKDVQFLLKKYKFSFRELIKTLDNSIVDGKLVVDVVDVSSTDMNNVLGLISSGSLVEIAKIADKINVENLAEELSINYLKYLSDVNSITHVIVALNELQKAISNNNPFLSISFLSFCNDLIRAKVKFRV